MKSKLIEQRSFANLKLRIGEIAKFQ